jgi:DNA invertase Pin-like site-specific DNA recombinase
MSAEGSQKVQAQHLRRNAYLYVRQSSLRQVMTNTESTERQYALRQRAVALGWSQEQIVVVDTDQAQSGATAADREGFQRLVSEVGLGRAGLVMGLEVSRLARNNADWHRLLEICALTETLILDEDGLYDCAHFNDRLVLGLKGTMSEAELHVLRARLRGGILNKARRGELACGLPIGFTYHTNGEVVLDPDRQIQQSLQVFFATFRRTGSALGTVKAFRAQGLLFPRRVRTGARRGELLWEPLVYARAVWLLHNPRYAGAFFFGRTRWRRTPGGGARSERLPRDEWLVLLPDTHAGYIGWEEFEENQRTLRENAQAAGSDRRKSPPREGPALLQGLVVCGRCGERMTVRYHQRQGRAVPDYVCEHRRIQYGESTCQSLPGGGLDEAIGALILDTVTPLTLEVALAVEQELKDRLAEAQALRRTHCERLGYEAELARRRYLQVDPENRLVADELERDWNDKLRAHRDGVEQCERQSQEEQRVLSEEHRAKIRRLATDFPALWHNPHTPQRERKRMVRLLVEDVTLTREGPEIRADVRFRGGSATTLRIAAPLSASKRTATPAAVVGEIDRLLDRHTPGEIAQILDAQELRSGQGKRFHTLLVQGIIRRHGLKDRYTRLRQRGMLTREEVAQAAGIHPTTVASWRQAGLLRTVAYNDRNDCLYRPPRDHAPAKHKHKGVREKLAAKRKNRRRRQTHSASCARGAV